MAMLAEKRTKTRYYLHHKTLNPRGNAWCEDSSKFGQRMLEKMGWTQGKGLGANESGSTDPVHVSYKWDSKGMGYKGADGDEAVAQQKDFDALLATLSSETQGEKDKPEITAPVEKSPKSLELMSQKSRARVHYHKFTRGKDLSRASRKDLACILGLPAESTPSPLAATEPVVPDVGPPIKQVMETTFGITTIAKGNINEYFKQKFKERKRKLGCSSTFSKFKRSRHSENVESSESTTHAAFEESEEQSVESQENEQLSEKERKKKKKKKNDVDFEDGACVGNSIQQNENDSTSTNGRRKSVTWGDVEVSFVSKYIKDMVDSSSDSLEVKVETVENEDSAGTAVMNKKKKKKEKKEKKDETGVMNATPTCSESKAPNFNDGIEVISNTCNNSSADAKKKQKKKTKTALVIDACNAEYALNLEATDDAGTKSKRKKGKKNVGSTDSYVEVKSVSDQHSGDSVFAPSQSKRQKRNKESKVVSSGSDNVIVPATSQCEVVNEEIRLISKKDKKKQMISAFGENSVDIKSNGEALTDHQKKGRKRRELGRKESDMGDPNLSHTKLPEEKKKKKKKKDGVENVNQTAADDRTLSLLSEIMPGSKRLKKQKQSSEGEEESECVPIEQRGELTLSALTQERMAKWRKRRKNDDDKNVNVSSHNEDSVEKQKSSTAKLEYNPSRPTHDYNHKRVFTALGYNVKNAVDKKISVQMPPSNFPGSNLDEIPGYGQAIKSC